MSDLDPDIDFKSIRSLNGSKREGFEELCTQLFRGETKGRGTYYRIDGSGGDGGVEAYRVDGSGTKVAVQAKYFPKLEKDQWRQLSKSVLSAQENHPELVEYLVMVPLDRTPAKIRKWDEHVAKWRKQAVALDISPDIEFTWVGLSELSNLLIQKKYRSHLVYWFGVPSFGLDWLKQHNQVAISLLGKRYYADCHVETEAGQHLEPFTRGEIGISRLRGKFEELLNQWTRFSASFRSEHFNRPECSIVHAELRFAVEQIEGFEWSASAYPALSPFASACIGAEERCRQLVRALWANKEKDQKRDGGKRKIGLPGIDPKVDSIDSIISGLEDLEQTLSALHSEVRACRLAGEKAAILIGSAGSGKSHLVADLVSSIVRRGQPGLLVLGECFLSADEPWTSILRMLHWDHSADDLLAALDQLAQLVGRPAIFCIDALNESEHRNLWMGHIVQFAARFDKYRHVRLLVSCRTDFIEITLPDSIRRGGPSEWPVVEHVGFGGGVIDAIQRYFSAFEVESTSFPPVLEEFKNPLFLRVFCEAFEGERIRLGALSFERVMQARVEKLCAQIRREIDCDPEDTRSALKSVAKLLASNGGQPLPRAQVRSVVLRFSPVKGATMSLYRRLVSNGILVETARIGEEGADEPSVFVRFPFERFSDYFIAKEILSNVDSAAEIRALFCEGQSLAFLSNAIEYAENRGVASVLAIILPETLGLELPDLIQDSISRHNVLEDFLESLSWRSVDSFGERADALVSEAGEAGIDLIRTLIRVSTIPKHRYNSEFLGKQLLGFNLPDREHAWTIPIASMSVWEIGGTLDSFVDWCFRVPTRLIPDEQALLASRLLLWFCTSNHRGLRKRATLSAIRLLVSRPQLVEVLVRELGDVDDPYLVERLFAVAAGVSMREPKGASLGALGDLVWRKVFSTKEVTPNILIRDYARTVLEACRAKGSLPAGIEVESFRPPYDSTWPLIQSEEDAKRFEDDGSWNQILQSVRTEAMAMYGDFGRYVMEAKTRYFTDKRIIEGPVDSKDRSCFPGMMARCWVLQRVEELGWSGERFGDWEDRLPHRGRQSYDVEEVKLERISKKYQWIALRELQGFLSDHFWRSRSYDGDDCKFEGAWQVSGREFDPSQRLVDLEGTNSQTKDLSRWKDEYPDPFGSIGIHNGRENWLVSTPPEFSPLLFPYLNVPEEEHEWLTIAGHYDWVERKPGRFVGEPNGQLKMWANLRSFIVAKDKKEEFIKRVQSLHFYGNGCAFPSAQDGWIGEYPWGGAFGELREHEWSDALIADVGIPYHITVCEWSGGSTLIPSPKICELLRLAWAGDAGKFRTDADHHVAGNVGQGSPGWTNPCVIRRDLLLAALNKASFDIVWCVVAEKSCWCSETAMHVFAKELECSAVYWLDGDIVAGGITKSLVQDFTENEPARG